MPSLCAAQGSATLYGAQNGDLVRIDPEADLLATPIGPFGRSISDMAYDSSTGVLFGVSTIDGNLSRINVDTGEATVIGNTGFSIISGLTYDSTNDVLYAYAREEPGVFDSNRSFFQVNRNDGSASFVSKPQIPISLPAYDAISDSMLGLGSDMNDDPVVYSINPNNGTTVQLGSFGDDIEDVPFNAGFFPLSLAHNQYTDATFVVVGSVSGPSSTHYNLFSFDKHNGNLVDEYGIGQNRQLTALAFIPNSIPEPSAIFVLGLASAVMSFRRSSDIRAGR